MGQDKPWTTVVSSILSQRVLVVQRLNLLASTKMTYPSRSTDSPDGPILNTSSCMAQGMTKKYVFMDC